MAFHHLFPSLSLVIIFTTSIFIVHNVSAQTPTGPLACSAQTPTCGAVLYHNSTGLTTTQIASFYSVNSSAISSISSGSSNKLDFLITVPCSCANPNVTGNLTGYMYDTIYMVQPNDTFVGVSSQIYSGQALRRGGEENQFIAGDLVLMHLLCGCGEDRNKTVVTYTVQNGDFLSSTAARLGSSVEEIMALNKLQDPASIFVGQVLFVPSDKSKFPLQY